MIEQIFYSLESFLNKQVSRRKFFKICFGWLAVLLSNNVFIKFAFAKAQPSSGRPKIGIKGNHDIVLVEGEDPYKNTIKAVELMGGMAKFVKKNSTVVIKPNMAWDRTPEQAANTDPYVVAALVELCYKAGAKRVNIFDNTCNEAQRCYESSGIPEEAKKKGANVYFLDDWNVVKAHFSYKSPMEGWPVYRDAVKCDTFINVPVLKDHRLTRLTLSMKNLMGVCSGIRGIMHVGIGRKLVDISDFINPDLTVIDAHRVLVRNGPSGGDLEDVIKMNKIIVATDPTLADSFASTLAGVDPMAVSYIKAAQERGYGSTDISGADIRRLKV